MFDGLTWFEELITFTTQNQTLIFFFFFISYFLHVDFFFYVFLFLLNLFNYYNFMIRPCSQTHIQGYWVWYCSQTHLNLGHASLMLLLIL
jgi:hypothetical protein